MSARSPAEPLRAFYTHQFELPLPPGHPFPMAKYRLLYERVAAAAAELDIELLEPRPASFEELCLAHDPDYVRRVFAGRLSASELRRIGFPWSEAMVERCRRSVGATIGALEAALGEGVGVNLAGGTHHAGRARGGGYCVFNDAVVALRAAQRLGCIARGLIIDLDVHQGDGTAEICRGDESIYTFSMHAERNYPAVKPPSDLDIALPDGTDDAAYLERLAATLPRVLTAARPDAAVYLAGADPFVGDRLGRLALSAEGLAARDRLVLETLAGAGIPVAVCMAGGYAEDAAVIAELHFATVAIAAGVARLQRKLNEGFSEPRCGARIPPS